MNYSAYFGYARGRGRGRPLGPSVHAEDAQPNEGINKRARENPPALRIAPPMAASRGNKISKRKAHGLPVERAGGSWRGRGQGRGVRPVAHHRAELFAEGMDPKLGAHRRFVHLRRGFRPTEINTQLPDCPRRTLIEQSLFLTHQLSHSRQPRKQTIHPFLLLVKMDRGKDVVIITRDRALC
jgi:hypothetical protein